jgi:hypothetical protein
MSYFNVSVYLFTCSSSKHYYLGSRRMIQILYLVQRKFEYCCIQTYWGFLILRLFNCSIWLTFKFPHPLFPLPSPSLSAVADFGITVVGVSPKCKKKNLC